MAYEYAVPVYISAKTADDLMLEMAKANRKHGMNLRFFNMQYANNKWYAWYHLDNSKALKQKVNNLFGDENKRVKDG